MKPSPSCDINTFKIRSSTGPKDITHLVQLETMAQKQTAFQVPRPGALLRSLTRSPSAYGTLHLENRTTEVPDCFGCSVAGDEKQKGATFNYARIFTWSNVVNHLHDALETTTTNMERGSKLNSQEVSSNKLNSNNLSILKYCGLAINSANGTRIEPKNISEYPPWSSLDSRIYSRMICAIFMALYVQWGTTGAALIIAILTEVRGLGCRSGSYILYASLSTLSFLMLFASSIFSHAAMLRHEAIQREKVAGNFVSAKRISPMAPTSWPTFFRVSSVITRISGRAIVVANTIWILLSSMWELTGFYDNCWCDSTYLSKGSAGWVDLFVTKAAMASEARAPWAGGVLLNVFVVVSSLTVFALYCRGNRN